MTCNGLRRIGLGVLVGAVLAGPLQAATWFPLGPYGGDARAIAADPANSTHLYLGTDTGWMYGSRDGGAHWTRIAHIANRNDLVIDHILVDPRNPRRLVVGAYCVDQPDGGVFLSQDGGTTWYEQAEMRGQSIRSMARSESDPSQIVAGTLQGIYRSMDGGTHWELISPAGSMEIHEVESIAIDPTDPQVIYAGTWHLPWKTVDGGQNWVSIKKGIIDDSDVFSIIIDPTKSNIVYVSACSGIYKSEDGGAEFRGGVTLNKEQGIPVSARRTRKLAQDPQHLDTVYAGTTEGLYRTIDGGADWLRMTSPDMIVNDVFVDPKNTDHVLLATDRGGVFSSFDGGVSFQPSNSGFSVQQVVAYAADAQNAATVYVGLVNDKETGGVFQSTDGGVSWQQDSTGLGGRDVFSLATTSTGTLLAGTGHGIFRLQDGLWTDSSGMAGVAHDAAEAADPPAKATVAKTSYAVPRRGAAAKRRERPAPVHHEAGPELPVVKRVDAVVYAMVASDNAVFAGTSDGLLRGDVSGMVWHAVTTLQMPETRFVAQYKSVLLVAGLKRIVLSMDEGATWDPIALPPELTQVGAIGVDGMNNLWVGGREGVFYSTDYGLTWKTLHNLFVTQVDGLYYDARTQRMLVTASNSTFAFAVHLPSYLVQFWDTGWNLRFVRPVGDHLIGATLYDGMVLQPRMVDSKEAAESASAGR
jgi:photosystem II stability/assembly factor-like uncharacterized protein